MFDKKQSIADFDPDLAVAMEQEVQRQEQHIELIASRSSTESVFRGVLPQLNLELCMAPFLVIA